MPYTPLGVSSFYNRLCCVLFLQKQIFIEIIYFVLFLDPNMAAPIFEKINIILSVFALDYDDDEDGSRNNQLSVIQLLEVLLSIKGC